jgi:hypothetical protein
VRARPRSGYPDDVLGFALDPRLDPGSGDRRALGLGLHVMGRAAVDGLRMQCTFGVAFAFSSLLTPFFMGTVIGAIATGQIPADASHASLRLGHSPPSARTWRGMHHCPFG